MNQSQQIIQELVGREWSAVQMKSLDRSKVEKALDRGTDNRWRERPPKEIAGDDLKAGSDQAKRVDEAIPILERLFGRPGKFTVYRAGSGGQLAMRNAADAGGTILLLRGSLVSFSGTSKLGNTITRYDVKFTGNFGDYIGFRGSEKVDGDGLHGTKIGQRSVGLFKGNWFWYSFS